MKKLILFLTVMACALSASAQDSLYINQKNGSIISYAIANVDSISFVRKITKAPSSDTIVVINGVKWATRNVAAPGTFATNPEDSGYLYQWNSKIGWSSTSTLTGWNSNWTGGYSSPATTDTWTTANDPSPAGWRVPTSTEIQTLLDANNVTSTWTTQNSVYGEKFTDKITNKSIFLPASGSRNYLGGGLLSSNGNYWSSSAYEVNSAYLLYFSSSVGWSHGYRAYGLSVRPVAK